MMPWGCTTRFVPRFLPMWTSFGKLEPGSVGGSDAIAALLQDRNERTVKKAGALSTAFWDSSALLPLCIQEITAAARFDLSCESLRRSCGGQARWKCTVQWPDSIEAEP